LPSGSEITIVSSGKAFLAKEDSWTFTLTYQTQVPLGDEPALRAQAQEVMSLVKADVDRAGFSIAVFTAQSPATGLVFKTTATRKFALLKDLTGAWILR
jgi:hypothetical protein